MSGGQSASVWLFYTRPSSRDLIVIVTPLAQRPAIVTHGLRTERSEVQGVPVLFVFGTRLVAPTPAVERVDLSRADHLIRALFEVATAAVVVNADDRDIDIAGMRMLLTDWLRQAR
jgi:hypothetical protein